MQKNCLEVCHKKNFSKLDPKWWSSQILRASFCLSECAAELALGPRFFRSAARQELASWKRRLELEVVVILPHKLMKVSSVANSLVLTAGILGLSSKELNPGSDIAPIRRDSSSLELRASANSVHWNSASMPDLSVINPVTAEKGSNGLVNPVKQSAQSQIWDAFVGAKLEYLFFSEDVVDFETATNILTETFAQDSHRSEIGKNLLQIAVLVQSMSPEFIERIQSYRQQFSSGFSKPKQSEFYQDLAILKELSAQCNNLRSNHRGSVARVMDNIDEIVFEGQLALSLFPLYVKQSQVDWQLNLLEEWNYPNAFNTDEPVLDGSWLKNFKIDARMVFAKLVIHGYQQQKQRYERVGSVAPGGTVPAGEYFP